MTSERDDKLGEALDVLREFQSGVEAAVELPCKCGTYDGEFSCRHCDLWTKARHQAEQRMKALFAAPSAVAPLDDPAFAMRFYQEVIDWNRRSNKKTLILVGYESEVAGAVQVILDRLRGVPSATARIAPPTEKDIAAYRDLFRSELDKNMNNSSGSPSTDAHRVALHAFVAARNATSPPEPQPV